jgi:hypothetical protein
LRDRTLAAFTAFLALAAAIAAPLPVHASVAPVKVVIIVGPVGSTTTYYRDEGNRIAATAAADGATVVKVYSPNATWPAVKAAVASANIIVYLGHGNGYPNPYSSTYLPDRTDGWGLNTTTTHGDADSWSAGTLVYCGEKALAGTLVSTDGANQWKYCGGSSNTDGIAPAAGFVMVYANACYAPGASEPGSGKPSTTVALQRVGYYSRSMLTALGASGYFATDQGATPLVHALITKPTTPYGDIYTANRVSGIASTDSPHPLVSGLRAWLGLRSTDPYYTYAFAGNPTRTFAGGTAALTLPPPPTSSSSTTAGVTIYNPARLIHFSAGSTTGYKFDSLGRVMATRTYSLASASSASASQRSKVIPGHPGAWYLIVNGVWAGYWVAESTRTYLPGIAEQVNYSPAHTVSFLAGTYTGYRFTSAWAVSSSKRYTLASSSSASTSSWAVINGRGYAYILNGVWAGYWVPTGGGVTVR